MDTPWDNTVKCGIELLDILNKANVPKHLYNKIINWADTNKKIINNNNKLPNRDIIIQNLSNRYNISPLLPIKKL